MSIAPHAKAAKQQARAKAKGRGQSKRAAVKAALATPSPEKDELAADLEQCMQ